MRLGICTSNAVHKSKKEQRSWEGLAPGSRLVYTFFKFKPEEYERRSKNAF
ncbi:hypothetical protein BVRB_5g119290 [Beta vulgaris subsp. vulgaris]|nr:hypothetical protein BVRB_5g119290 [Beta vulgaris subsp. vulgaris]